MVDISFRVRGIFEMNKINYYISALVSAIECAEQERTNIRKGCDSLWNYDQIINVVLPELTELLSYAKQGELFFKYGKKQRMLESSYIITDSMQDLNHTTLGGKLQELQKAYSSL